MIHNLRKKAKWLLPAMSFTLLAACAQQGVVPVQHIGDAFHPNLDHKIVKKTLLTSGVLYTKTAVGHINPEAYYHLSTGIVVRANQDKLVNRIKLINPGVSVQVMESPEAALDTNDLGVIIHVGHFKKKRDADRMAKMFKLYNLNMKVRYSEEDGYDTATGPFNVHMLTINPKMFRGHVITALAQDRVMDRETTSSIAKRKHAIAATNAGFFVFKPSLGTDGSPAGISIVDGQMVAEPINHRPAFVLYNKGKKVHAKMYHNVVAHFSFTAKGRTLMVDGVNRAPGKSFNCGNPGDTPLTTPAHDFLCTDKSEVIVFNSAFGHNTPKGEGMEIVFKDGRMVYRSEHRGHYLLPGQASVQFTGKMVDVIKKVDVRKKDAIRIEFKLDSNEGRIRLQKGMYAVNGGPSLVRDGMLDFTSRMHEGFAVHNDVDDGVKDKFADKKDQASDGTSELKNRAGFYYGWVLRRHPRTAIGITKDGRILLATVYGRQADIEGGATITEMSQLMKSYGAYNAMNLDGGGSTMMVVNGHKTGKSSDRRERPDADAILITK